MKERLNRAFECAGILMLAVHVGMAILLLAGLPKEFLGYYLGLTIGINVGVFGYVIAWEPK